jgi:hypothetical protein
MQWRCQAGFNAALQQWKGAPDQDGMQNGASTAFCCPPRESALERLQPAGLREKLRFPARLACCEQIPDRLRIIPQASLCFGSEVPGAACKARNIYSRMPLALQIGWSAAWFAQCTVRRLGGH